MAARKEVTFVIRARDLTRRVFSRIGQRLRRLRVSFGSLLALGGFSILARQATEAATEIQGVSDRLGLTVEQVQALQVIAADVGVPFSTLATTLQRVARNFGGALRGSGELQEDFAGLGIALDPNRFQGSLDLFQTLVDNARQLGIESQVIQDTIAGIADTEGLDIIQRLVRRGGNLRLEVDELSKSVRSAAEIRQAAAEEAKIRRELLVVQKAFAEELRLLLPAIVELTRAVNDTIGLVNQFRAGGESRDEALTQASEAVSSALGLGGVRGLVRGESELTGGRALGSALFEAREAAGSVGVRAFEAQLAVRELLQRIADNTEQQRGAFRIGK